MFMCEICKTERAKYMVDLKKEKDSYKYKTTYRCEGCKDRAVRSFDDVEVKKL